jgi:hypothetical protein
VGVKDEKAERVMKLLEGKRSTVLNAKELVNAREH